jgi:hypothetical protein
MSRNNIETITIDNKDLIKYLTTRLIKNIIPINKDTSTLLLYTHVTLDTLDNLNTSLDVNLNNIKSIIKSNVAIAAAITAYARFNIIPFILNKL